MVITSLHFFLILLPLLKNFLSEILKYMLDSIEISFKATSLYLVLEGNC